MTIRPSLFIAPLALALAGCGGGGKPAAPPPERNLKQGEGPAGAMSAWGKKLEVDCPDSFDIPKRPDGAVVDDIRGLRLGVLGETAIRFAQCPDGEEADSVLEENTLGNFSRDQAGLKIRNSGSVAVGKHHAKWRNRDVFNDDLSRVLERADSIWHFQMDGMPGAEKLYAMWLEQPFAEGARPTIESQIAALKAKYGEPNYSDDRGTMFWLHLPDGKPIPSFDRELMRNCSYSIGVTGHDMRWGPDCGLVVAAAVQPSQNPLQASAVRLAVFDPAKLWDYQEHRFPAERDAMRASQAGAESGKAKGGNF